MAITSEDVDGPDVLTLCPPLSDNGYDDNLLYNGPWSRRLTFPREWACSVVIPLLKCPSLPSSLTMAAWSYDRDQPTTAAWMWKWLSRHSSDQWSSNKKKFTFGSLKWWSTAMFSLWLISWSSAWPEWSMISCTAAFWPLAELSSTS